MGLLQEKERDQRLSIPGKMLTALLTASILAVASAQKPTEIKESELYDLTKPTEGAVLEKSFRCGSFFIDPNEPPPEEGGRPAKSLLIFNATWDAADECPGGNYDRYKSFCNSIWEKVQKGKVLVLTSPSLSKKRAAEGHHWPGHLRVSQELREGSFCWEKQQKVPQWSRVWYVRKCMWGGGVDLYRGEALREGLLQKGNP